MPDSDILNTLISNLMSERQAKVYLALLKSGEAGPSELQRVAGIPLSKISETANYLLSNGYINARKEGKKRIYNAVNPEIALKRNIAQLESKIETLNELMKDLGEYFKQSGQSTELFEYIEVIHGNDNIHNRYLEFLRSIEFEFLTFTRPPFAASNDKLLSEQEAIFMKLLEKGVKFRGIYEINENSEWPMFRILKNSHEAGAVFRIAPKLPLKMFIFDQKTLLLTDRSSLSIGNELSQTVIKQKTTVDGYVTLFEFFWDQALEYDAWIKENEDLMERMLAADSE